jgi:hypothetical protein
MTDEELVKRLRDKRQKGNRFDSLEYEAADRIEALIVERDEAWRRAGNAEEQWGRCELKLAKAVQLLRKHCDTWAMNDFDAETLAELLGEKG